MDLKEKTLSMALSEVGLHDLPKLYRDGDKGFWIKAIVLVKKRNTTQSYMFAEHRADGLIVYTKDFSSICGNMSPMAGLIGIYPYMYLDEERYMNFNNIQDIVSSIAVMTNKKYFEYQNMDEDEIRILYRKCAIEKQLEDISENNFDNSSVGIEDKPKEIVSAEQKTKAEDAVNKDDEGETILGDGDEFDDMKTLLTPVTSKSSGK